MSAEQHRAASISDINLRKVLVTLVFAMATIVLAPRSAQAQTFQVLHNFTGGQDGAGPLDGLTIDRNGNLYGTASAGGYKASGCSNGWGQTGCGGVFELARSGTGWILRPLYDFKGGSDYGNPGEGVVFGPDGALYGSTGSGGNCDYYTCGGVFRLRPPPTSCASFVCNWQETVLHQFTGQPDGSYPASRVVFDPSGNMYGITFFGGLYNEGAAYELSPQNGGWTENVIYSFNPNLGLGVSLPGGPIVLDQAGNIYGTAYCNEIDGCYGSVWQLQPSQSDWDFNSIFEFNGSDGYELTGLVSDPSGNLYRFTDGQTGNSSATAYELSPSNGGWTYSLVYDLGFEGNFSAPSMDSVGNLYGSNIISGYGTLFKLTRSGNTWTYSTLHEFSGADGEFPTGYVVFDKNGNMFGTTIKGGAYGYGVIWEITP